MILNTEQLIAVLEKMSRDYDGLDIHVCDNSKSATLPVSDLLKQAIIKITDKSNA